MKEMQKYSSISPFLSYYGRSEYKNVIFFADLGVTSKTSSFSKSKCNQTIPYPRFLSLLKCTTKESMHLFPWHVPPSKY